MMKLPAKASLVVVCAALLGAAACSRSAQPESPISPSASTQSLVETGATIAGVVQRSGGGPASIAPSSLSSFSTLATASGLKVSVVGTDLSAVADESGRFQIAGVPPGDVRLQFGDAVASTVVLPNVGEFEQIEIQVSVGDGTANIVSEVRSSGKIQLCHRSDGGRYHLIDVSVSAEPAHRAHGDGAVGDPVPGDPTKVFDAACNVGPLARIDIEKSTNGRDADAAPGPSITVGSPVTWQYVVRNTGTVDLTNVVVSDNRSVVVNCGGQTLLAAGQSMTCTGTGTAVLGQYENIGTVTAQSIMGAVTDSDASHYLGVAPEQEPPGLKVQLCHRTGNGRYHLIEVSVSAERAHRAHGDGKIGEAVPGRPGSTFQAGCAVSGP